MKQTLFLFKPLFWLIVVFGVGLGGLLIPETRSFFNELTPYNLIFSALMIFLSLQEDQTLGFLKAFILIACLGWTAEWIGVHTGWLFGSYSYGKILGWGPMEIPLLIGLNWAILSYCIFQWTRFLTGWKSYFLGAFIMTAFDALLEPVAIKLAYWQWNEGIIPWTNYLTWWLLSIPCMYLWDVHSNKQMNQTAAGLLLIQILFFAVLNFVL
jgi:bisanhydrobacterioruberin hydratase